jgi:hypothetical protein
MLLALLAGSVQAATPTANPSRPSFSDNAAPTDTGAMELELGTAFEPEMFSTNYILKFGLHKRVDFRLGFEQAMSPVYAPGAFTFLFKGTLIQSRDRVLGAAIAPYLSWQPGTDPGFGAYLIVSYPQGDVQIDANLLIEAIRYNDAFQFQLDPVLTIGFPLVGNLGGYVEAYGIIPTYNEIQPALGLAFGLDYEARKNIVLDAAFDAGFLNHDLISPWKVQLGVTFSGYLIPPEREATTEPDRNSNGEKNNGKKNDGKNKGRGQPNSTLR